LVTAVGQTRADLRRDESEGSKCANVFREPLRRQHYFLARTARLWNPAQSRFGIDCAAHPFDQPWACFVAAKVMEIFDKKMKKRGR
jgi:hypothetical protein